MSSFAGVHDQSLPFKKRKALGVTDASKMVCPSPFWCVCVFVCRSADAVNQTTVQPTGSSEHATGLSTVGAHALQVTAVRGVCLQARRGSCVSELSV